MWTLANGCPLAYRCGSRTDGPSGGNERRPWAGRVPTSCSARAVWAWRTWGLLTWASSRPWRLTGPTGCLIWLVSIHYSLATRAAPCLVTWRSTWTKWTLGDCSRTISHLRRLAAAIWVPSPPCTCAQGCQRSQPLPRRTRPPRSPASSPAVFPRNRNKG